MNAKLDMSPVLILARQVATLSLARRPYARRTLRLSLMYRSVMDGASSAQLQISAWRSLMANTCWSRTLIRYVCFVGYLADLASAHIG
jgi:hypothetical protein